MALDRVACPFKLGNKITAPGKEMRAPRHLMPVGYISEAEWGQPLEAIISRHCARCFAFVIYDQSDIPMLRQAQAQPDQPDAFYAQQKLDHTAVPRPILDNWDDPSTPHPLIPKSQLLRDDHFVSSSTEPLGLNNHKPDRNAVSEGAYTVGAAADYATWALAIADRANNTADLTFTQVTNTTENAQSLSIESLNNFTTKYTSNTNPFGQFDRPHITSQNFDLQLFRIEDEGPGTLIISFLQITTLINQLTVDYIFSTNIVTPFDFFIQHCLFDGSSYDKPRAIRTASSNETGALFASLFTGFSTLAYATLASNFHLESISINDSGGGIDLINRAPSCINILCLNPRPGAPNACFNRTAFATGRNNAADDNSCQNGFWNVGTNNLINLTPADEVRSLTPTDGPLFMLPILNSNIYNGGLAFTIPEHQRYATGFLGHTPWAIGAKQVYPPYHPSSIATPVESR